MTPRRRRPTQPLVAIVLAALTVACVRGERVRDSRVAGISVVRDSAGGLVAFPLQQSVSVTTVATRAFDDPGERPPRDANQGFLREMVDHHAGLLALSDSLLAYARGTETAERARAWRAVHEEEQYELRRMLAGWYDDQHEPMILAEDAAAIDTLMSAGRGEALAARWLRLIAAHHIAELECIERFRVQLDGEVLSMAELMSRERDGELSSIERVARRE